MTKNLFVKTLFKCFLPFIITLLGSRDQIKPSFSTGWFSQLLRTLFGSNINNLLGAIDPPILENSSNNLSFEPANISDEMGSQGSLYLWFLAIMMMLEFQIWYFTKKSPERASIHQQSQQQTDYDTSQVLHYTHSQKVEHWKFALHMLKMLLLYSLCYLLYMMIFVVVCFAYDAYTHRQGSLAHQMSSYDGLKNPIIQENYQSRQLLVTDESTDPSDTDGSNQASDTDSSSNGSTPGDESTDPSDTDESNKTTGPNSSPASDSSDMDSSSQVVTPDLGWILYESMANVIQGQISQDGNTIFLVTDSHACDVQILDISVKTSPKYLGSVSYNETCRSPAIIAQEEAVFLQTDVSLKIINISNLVSPTTASSISFPRKTSVNSFYVLTDNKAIYIAYDFNKIRSYIEIIDISNIQYPSYVGHFSNNSRDAPYYSSILRGASNGDLLFVAESDESDFDYSDGWTLFVYNISDAHNPVQTVSIDIPRDNPFFMSLSSQFIYTLTDTYASSDTLWVNELSVITIVNNSLVTQGKVGFREVESSTIPNLVQFSDNIHVMIVGNTYLQIIDVSDPSNPQLLSSNLKMPDGFKESTITLSSDGTTALAVGPLGFCIIQLNINVRITQGFNLQNNVLHIMDFSKFLADTESWSEATTSDSNDDETLLQIVLSPDGDTLYISTQYTSTMVFTSANSTLIVLNVSDPSNWTFAPSIQLQNPPTQMMLSSDGKTLFTVEYDEFNIYNISGSQLLSSFSFPENWGDDSDRYSHEFAITQNENVAVITQDSSDFAVLDISNRSNISLLSTNNPFGEASLLANGNFLVDYNPDSFSEPSLPPLLPSKTGPDWLFGAVSSDGSTAYTLLSSSDSDFDYDSSEDTPTLKLNVINISSSIANATLIESIDIPGSTPWNNFLSAFPLFPDGEVLIVPLSDSIAVYDISIPSAPKLLDYFELTQTQQSQVIVSPDYSTLYVQSNSIITAFSLTPDHVLYLQSNTLSLGNPYSATLNVLTKNSIGVYDAKLPAYKFTSLSLYTLSTDLSLSFYTALPTWITLYQETGILSCLPNAASQLGVYHLSGILSTQMPQTVFEGVINITNSTNSSLELFVELVSLGYIDNEGYLTANFNPSQTLLLSQQYANQELEIRNVLTSYYIQAFTSIHVIPSLTLSIPETLPSPISINTSSIQPLNVKVFLKASGNQQPKFVSTGYSFDASFLNDNSEISMFMSLTDINTALSQLIIFLNGSESCTANITATDGLNPILNQSVPNIAQYFRVNSPPSINLSYFSSQVSKISPKTGEQFVLQFDSSTFADSNNQSLAISVQMQDGSEVPEWLEIKGFTLIGTPPDQLTGRELELTLVVSNQYQSSEVNFTLDAGISFDYAFTIALRYGGAVVALIGLYVYAFTIYNILFKKSYQYPKDFIVRAGQDIAPKTLYPITFAAEAIEESRIIIRHLDQTIAKLLKDNSKAKIAAFFTNEGTCQINRDKLIQAIEESVTEIQNEGKDELTLYTTVMEPQKELINQLILNTFIIRLVDLDQEKLTKKAFNRIKNELFSVVDFDRCLLDGLCIFSVNRQSLNEKIVDYKMIPFEKEGESEASLISKTNFSSQIYTSEVDKSDMNLEAELIPVTSNIPSRSKFSLDMDLLVAALEAYTFNYHIIDANIEDVNIIASRRLPNILFESVRRFLKRDLLPIGLSGKGVVGYGIEYKVQENALMFCGTANRKVKNVTLVLQIVNLRGRILRELVIYGVNADYEGKTIIDINHERSVIL